MSFHTAMSTPAGFHSRALVRRLKRLSWVAAVGWTLALAMLATGQRPPSGQTAQAAEVATLSGRAINSQTGEALDKVELRLFSGRSNAFQGASVFTARSSADGSFQFSGMPAGDYLLDINRRAFATQAAELRGLPSARPQGRGWMVTIRAGQATSGIEVRMPPAAVVTGQVFDEEGEPMVGIMIEAEQYRYIRGTKTLAAGGRATTDDRGIYRIFDLSPGRYFVKAQGRRWRARFGAAIRGGMGPGFGGPGQGFGRMGGPGGAAGAAAEQESASYPETYYPTARSAAEAIPLQLGPGMEMGGIDFTLRPSPTYSISGTVNAVVDGDRPSVLVTARDANQPGFVGDAAGMAPANPQSGEFILRGLPPGSYQVIARVNVRRGGNAGGGGTDAIGATPVELGNSSVDGVIISVHEDVAVSGKVVLPEGYSTDQLAGMSVIPERRLVPVRSQARVDANGAFSISISPSEPARFTVSNMPEGLYLKRMVLGATDLLASSSPKSVDASGQLVLELASDGATVSGSIRDSRGTAISGARVTLLPARDLASADDPARDAWKKSILTSDDGSFQITAIAPGRYRVYAFETLDADPSFDPDFLSNFGQRWKEVDLKAKDNATLDLQLIPASDTALYLGEVQ